MVSLKTRGHSASGGSLSGDPLPALITRRSIPFTTLRRPSALDA